MADALKTFFSPALVQQLARDVAAVHPAFDSAAFVRDATKGQGALELVARAKLIATALHRHLPAKYSDAIDVLLRSLDEEHTTDELEGVGMAPFFYMPHAIFVAEHGLDERDFALSMRAQHEITRRFTAEFSIRPFLERYPDKTLAALAKFARDRNPHVRRLASEGTRPRLPWASRVSWLDREPERVLPLLEQLKSDSTTLVRRSVANHLNDIAKFRPDLTCEIAARWLAEEQSEARRALVTHALRSLIKKGHPRALAILGFGGAPNVVVRDVSFTPPRVAVGDRTRVALTVASKARKAQTLSIDMIVHFVKARGQTSPKVFKLARIELAPGAVATLGKNVSLAVHTTRKPNPGAHRVEALINGKRFDLGAFTVTAERATKRASRRA